MVSGLLNSSRQLGGSLALAVLATVASRAGDGGGLHALAHGYHAAFVLSGVLLLVAAVVAVVWVPPHVVPATPAPVEEGAAA